MFDVSKILYKFFFFFKQRQFTYLRSRSTSQTFCRDKNNGRFIYWRYEVDILPLSYYGLTGFPTIFIYTCELRHDTQSLIFSSYLRSLDINHLQFSLSNCCFLCFVRQTFTPPFILFLPFKSGELIVLNSYTIQHRHLSDEQK